MRRFIILLRNLLVALFVLTQNLLKGLGLRARSPDWVVLDLRGHPTHRPLPWRQRFAERLAGRAPGVDLFTLSERFDRLAAARDVRGVILRVDGLSAGASRLLALGERVRRLRAAGKQVVIWTARGGSAEAPLLFGGDRLYLAPGGQLDVRGFAAELGAYGAGLERLGASVVVVRRGSHKTAADPLSRPEPSPEQKETVSAILDERHARLVEVVSAGRGLSADDAGRIVDQAPYSGARAEEAGLVDGRCHADELAAVLAPEGRPKARLARWAGFEASRLSPLGWKPILARRRAVAVVPIRGLILEGASRRGGPLQAAGHRSVAEALAMARRIPWVRAVVLEIDSRGGSALASDLIWREIRRTVEKKPVVAFFDTVAASGGYYCAAAASAIVAGSQALTGSIGVLSMLVDLSKLYERLGIRREIVARGARAALGTTARPPTAEEQDALETESDAAYGLFLDRVAEGRALSRDAVAERAEGRVYTGSRAEALGLVDALGDFEDAVDRARALAGLSAGAPFEVVTLEARGEGGGGLFALARSVQGAAGPAARLLDAHLDPFVLGWLEAAARSRERVWAVMPERIP